MSSSNKPKELPAEFWTQPWEDLAVDQPLQLIYAEVIARLRAESPEADTIELMLMERCAFLYVHIRHKEQKKLFAHDRSYKETLQLWTQMLADMRKQRNHTESFSDVRDAIIDAMKVAVINVAKAFDAETGNAIKEKFLEELDTVGV